MSEDTASGQAPFQDSRSNSSQAYLKRAASAVAEGDSVLGIHLYLAPMNALCAKASCRAKRCLRA